MRYTSRWTVGEWTFVQVEDHSFRGELEGRPLFVFGTGALSADTGLPKLGNEFYTSLEHAMVSAVGEKYTGPRGAGGTGVGTAADWFMKMIGADQP